MTLPPPIIRPWGLTEWIEENENDVNHTIWPSHSPHLNPVDHLWECSLAPFIFSPLLSWKLQEGISFERAVVHLPFLVLDTCITMQRCTQKFLAACCLLRWFLLLFVLLLCHKIVSLIILGLCCTCFSGWWPFHYLVYFSIGQAAWEDMGT